MRRNSGDARERELERRIIQGDESAWIHYLAERRRRGSSSEEIVFATFETASGQAQAHGLKDRVGMLMAQRFQYALAKAAVLAKDYEVFLEIAAGQRAPRAWIARLVLGGIVPSFSFLKNAWSRPDRVGLLPEEKWALHDERTALRRSVGLARRRPTDDVVIVGYERSPDGSRPIQIVGTLVEDDEDENHWTAWVSFVHAPRDWPANSDEDLEVIWDGIAGEDDFEAWADRVQGGDLAAWGDVYLSQGPELLPFGSRTYDRHRLARDLVLEIALEKKGWL